MKTISNLLFTFSILLAAQGANAGTTYNITSNKAWSVVIPATCANCTLNISAGVTLTVDEDVTCQECTFSGGNMTMGAHTMNLQFITATTTTFFTGINFTVNSGTVTANAPLSMTNSTFTLNGTSTMTTSYQDDLVNSKIKLNGSSSLTANGGGATNFNLSSGSGIQIGDGTTTSTAKFTVSGPTLNIYDTSTVAAEGNKNNFYDWSNYNTAATAAGAKTSHATFNNSNPNLNMNCGGSYPNACSNPNLYGPATLSTAGTTMGATLLPILLSDFSAELNIDKVVVLKWETAQESNSNYFSIERSQDGSAWISIGTVKAAGASATTIVYDFTDEHPEAGINYYRLSMVDRDGRYTYSDVKIIRASSLVNKITVYPNPSSNYVNVSFGQGAGTEVTIRLVNQSGQVLMEKKAAGAAGATVTFPVQQYTAGLYFLSVSGADGSHENSKLLISHS
jgi:trimeric autotransporter adhesin